MSEFAFNGNAGIYSSSAQSQTGALTAAQQVSVAAAAVVELIQHEGEAAAAGNQTLSGTSQISGDRQIELLLWLSNLSLRLPPYGDLN